MSWQSHLMQTLLGFGKWQVAHQDIHTVTAMMRLYLNRLAELSGLPSWASRRDEIIAGVPCEWIGVAAEPDAPGVILYLHGGGFVAGSPASHRDLAWRLAKAAGMRVLLVDYRLAPEFPFPAQRDDALAVYRALLDRGVAPDRLAVAGDSAGGNLALSLLLAVRELALPMPAAVVAISTWGDLTHSGESIALNARRDHVIPVRLIDRIAAMYVGEQNADEQTLRQPSLSPVFADFTGFPPMQLHCAEEEVLRDDTVRIAHRAKADGVAVEGKIWKGVPHAFPAFAQFLPEGKTALKQIGAFLRAQCS
jgi:acetyl esterase/lipase